MSMICYYKKLHLYKCNASRAIYLKPYKTEARLDNI
jgi:hypothetical protein